MSNVNEIVAFCDKDPQFAYCREYFDGNLSLFITIFNLSNTNINAERNLSIDEFLHSEVEKDNFQDLEQFEDEPTRKFIKSLLVYKQDQEARKAAEESQRRLELSDDWSQFTAGSSNLSSSPLSTSPEVATKEDIRNINKNLEELKQYVMSELAKLDPER